MKLNLIKKGIMLIVTVTMLIQSNTINTFASWHKTGALMEEENIMSSPISRNRVVSRHSIILDRIKSKAKAYKFDPGLYKCSKATGRIVCNLPGVDKVLCEIDNLVSMIDNVLDPYMEDVEILKGSCKDSSGMVYEYNHGIKRIQQETLNGFKYRIDGCFDSVLVEIIEVIPAIRAICSQDSQMQLYVDWLNTYLFDARKLVNKFSARTNDIVFVGENLRIVKKIRDVLSAAYVTAEEIR